MENLIFGAFATLDGYREGDAANLGRTVYDRCTVVALCSAKAQNPACTVALLTNAPVPEPFRSQLTQGGVEIWDCPFTTYRVPADTNWALAYYKLCAMAWVLENRDFARAAMLDLDTFTQRPLDDLWRECDEAVLKGIFTWQSGAKGYTLAAFADTKLLLILAASFLLCGPVQALCPKLKAALYAKKAPSPAGMAGLLVLLFLGLMRVTAGTYSAFIYFQF